MSPERYARINQMLDNRQTDLTLCLDTVHKTQNIAAVIRTADAVGIHQIHAVWPDADMRVSGNTASGSQQWVKTIQYNSMSEAAKVFNSQGMQVLATNFSAKAIDFRDIDYTKPTVVIMGNERDGVRMQALPLPVNISLFQCSEWCNR